MNVYTIEDRDAIYVVMATSRKNAMDKHNLRKRISAENSERAQMQWKQEQVKKKLVGVDVYGSIPCKRTIRCRYIHQVSIYNVSDAYVNEITRIDGASPTYYND